MAQGRLDTVPHEGQRLSRRPAAGITLAPLVSLPTPNRFALVVGAAEGQRELTAFDAALTQAGVANVNLLRVSSILPPGAEYVAKLALPPGALVPIAYGTIASSRPGDLIAAGIGAGLSADTYGVIMEFSGYCTQEEAAAEVEAMINEAFARRGIPLVRSMVRAIQHKVENIGCVFAGAPLWYRA